jgi:2-polyprenyl-3-methyl-5-hydroxy-6-metoxy-1,4-benzoquinol methylase
MWRCERPILTNNRNFRKDIPAANAHFNAAEHEMSLLPRENGIICDNNLVEFVQCPVCSSAEYAQLFVKWGSIHVQCDLCSHVYVQNRLRWEKLTELYQHSEVDNLDRIVQQSPQHKAYWGKVYAKYFTILQKEMPIKTLLDVGCGSGEFLDFCKKNTKIDLFANEIAQESFKDLIKLVGKDNLFSGSPIEIVDFGELRFDMISFWGVLEHITNPLEVMKKCRKLLTDIGRIFILVPNIFSKAYSILGIETPTINPRAHVNFYTPKSMNVLCKKAELRVECQAQELPIIDLMYPYIDYSEAFVENIINNNMSYYHVYVLTRL